MEQHAISRRDFLKLLGLASGGVILASCGASGAGGNGVRIMIDSWALAYAPFKDMAKKYNELHPGANIKIEATPGGWMTKVVGQIRSDEVQWSAAGVMSPFNDMAAWIQLGVIQPLSDYLTASTEPEAAAFTSDLLAPIKDDESIDGKMYGTPFSLENITYQWNTEWYAKAGIKTAPKTWQELYDYAKAVKDVLAKEGNTETYPLGFDLGHLNRNLGTLFFSISDKPYTEDGWFNWKSDEMRESLRFMRKLSRDGLTPPNCGQGLEIVDMWTRGRLAGLYSPSSRGLWAQKIIGFEKVITSQVPTMDGAPHSGTAFWCNSIALINKAPMPQQAIDFLVYACGPNNADWQRAIIKAGTSPAFESVYSGQLQTDSEVAAFKWMTEVRDQVKVSIPAPKNYYYPIQNEAWTRHWPDYLKDDSAMTEDELIDKVLASSQEILATVRESVPTLVP